MNDITKEIPAEAREVFEKDVTAVMQQLFQKNCELIDGGFDPRPIGLALALSSVDVAASMAANLPEAEAPAALDRLLDLIASDMRTRAKQALPHYIGQAVKQRAEALAAGMVQP